MNSDTKDKVPSSSQHSMSWDSINEMIDLSDPQYKFSKPIGLHQLTINDLVQRENKLSFPYLNLNSRLIKTGFI